jgi:hypothetical protein
MMNNYLHDIATALLAASGAALWVIVRRYDRGSPPDTRDYFVRIYKGMTSVAKFSLYWILIGGVPRTIFYKKMEWQVAVDHAQIPALIIKHVLTFMVVGLGVYLWMKINKEVKQMRAAEGGAEPQREK